MARQVMMWADEAGKLFDTEAKADASNAELVQARNVNRLAGELIAAWEDAGVVPLNAELLAKVIAEHLIESVAIV